MDMKNEKLSSRQIFRLYVFDLMGIATLLIPPYLAKLCGVNGIYGVGLGIIISLIYLAYLGWIMKKMECDMSYFMREKICPWIAKPVNFFIMFHCVITAGFLAFVFANLMKYSLVREAPYFLILLLVSIVAGYAVSGGIKSRARVYEVVFWFVLLPYIVMMLVSIRDFRWEYVEPVLKVDMTNLGKGTYLVFLLFTPLFFSLFLVGENEKKYGKDNVKTIAFSVLVSGMVLLGSYLLLLGNFGANSLANLRFPVVTLMSTIQFEGNFLKRMDALMLAVWFFTLYALLNLHLHYGVKMLQDLGVRGCKKIKWWQIGISIIGSFAIAYGMHIDEVWLELFLKYYSYVAVPFMIVIPLFLIVVRKDKNR